MKLRNPKCGQPHIPEMSKTTQKKKISPQHTKVQKGHVALFTNGLIIGGECMFTATKADKFSGEAVFQITLVKDLTK